MGEANKPIMFLIIILLGLLILSSGCTEEKIKDANQNIPSKTEVVDCIIQKPGSDNYNISFKFESPLNISEEKRGPGNTTTLRSCIEYCSENLSCECMDWIQSIYLSL